MGQKRVFCLFVCFVYLIFLFVCLFVLLMGLLAVDAATTLTLFLTKICYLPHLNLTLMYRSNRSFNMPPPPRAYPGHLTPLPSRGGGNLII